MANTVNFNITDLRLKDARLYKDVIAALGLGELSGDISLVSKTWFDIPYDVRARLTDYLRAVNPNPDAHVKKAGEHEKYCPCEECFNKHVAENNRKEKERLALAAQAKAAAARLRQYMREQGLRDSEHNRLKWSEFESKLPKDIQLSADLIDQFVSGWRSVLEWDTPSPAPAPEPEPVFLSDGSVQKPLDETPNNSWSVAQCKDWFARNDGQKKLREQQFGGGSRSNFFKPDSQVV